jgi:hypothetical protein
VVDVVALWCDAECEGVTTVSGWSVSDRGSGAVLVEREWSPCFSAVAVTGRVRAWAVAVFSVSIIVVVVILVVVAAVGFHCCLDRCLGGSANVVSLLGGIDACAVGRAIRSVGSCG